MKKRAALVAVVVAMLSVIGAPAAQASCTEVVDGQCVETIACQAVTGTKPTSGWNCIE